MSYKNEPMPYYLKELENITMENIIRYLTKEYNPDAIITYGSYADGSNNENSDFDALIIAENNFKHDTTIVDNISLDVFVYPKNYFNEDYDIDEFIQIFDGNILLDKSGIAKILIEKVHNYIREIPVKSSEELDDEIKWCYKMLLRAKRNDDEGYFRWHWLLEESLQIYCDVKEVRYLGPKKSLKQMKMEDITSYNLYSKALKEFSYESLACWINKINELLNKEC